MCYPYIPKSVNKAKPGYFLDSPCECSKCKALDNLVSTDWFKENQEATKNDTRKEQ